jgi:two-component system response regulator
MYATTVMEPTMISLSHDLPSQEEPVRLQSGNPYPINRFCDHSSPIDQPAVDVLLVEDNRSDEEMILRVVKKGGRGGGATVHVCRDGVEALEFLSQTALPEDGHIHVFPRLILLDLNLPRLNGFQFLEHIKQHGLLRCIPVVVLTGSPDLVDVQRCYELGANSYVIKPGDYKGYQDTLGVVCDYWLSKNEIPEYLAQPQEFRGSNWFQRMMLGGPPF